MVSRSSLTLCPACRAALAFNYPAHKVMAPNVENGPELMHPQTQQGLPLAAHSQHVTGRRLDCRFDSAFSEVTGPCQLCDGVGPHLGAVSIHSASVEYFHQWLKPWLVCVRQKTEMDSQTHQRTGPQVIRMGFALTPRANLRFGRHTVLACSRPDRRLLQHCQI